MHPDQFRLAKPATNDAADDQTELGRLAERYHAALTEIAGMHHPDLPRAARRHVRAESEARGCAGDARCGARSAEGVGYAERQPPVSGQRP